MASTAKTATPLRVNKTSLSGDGVALDFAYGRTALSSGSVTVDTGLSSVEMFVCTPAESIASTKHLLLAAETDLPVSSGGSVAVKGVVIDDDEATLADVIVPATSEVFNWIALGSR